jgi:hypothetical protein
MPSQSRKHRGYKTQDIVAIALREDIYPYAESTGAGRSGRDITGTPGVWLEVKARTGFDPLAALRQAHEAAGELDIVAAILRMNGQGPATVDEFVTCLRFGTFRRLLREAGYGGPAPATGRLAAIATPDGRIHAPEDVNLIYQEAA